ncbi:hypothetical protein PAECIP112173_01775 [Paenibacillus sp. JJ-100]|uniref:polysaccharide deacetylase family protein n=1 Tax=Paenibacillus sp. JJ-100 TaxID=2974896 RepID=UPI0022FFBC1E|nr:polysaccharide deacetylase family protein [Paenibacillus sp. JJ-100]CAI6060760.1 hypothetical protein PAECIP112173_01775 [Paenibacillus sp. JJ-100]
MLKPIVSLLLMLSFLLSACSPQNPSAYDSISQEESVSKPSAEETNPESKSISVTQTLDEPVSEEIVDKAFYMNSNYVIKPIDASRPKKVVLLTFDDGPKEEKLITSIINTLDKHHAKAIFFVNGDRVKKQPDLLKMIHDRGQIIGNHAWNHDDLKKMPISEATKQIIDVQKIVKETIGVEPQFFRPPYGSGNDKLKDAVEQAGLLYMTWSNGSLDWDMSTKNKPDKVIQNVLDQLHPGSNILMHELPWTAEALDDLLTQLEQKGYSFVDPREIELKTR